MARLVLVGLPATGKTTVAQALAGVWHCDYVDTDALIADRLGYSVGEYLRANGEPAFRERELEALRQALSTDVVVATGGGVVVTAPARTMLCAERTYWLDCDVDVLVERLADGDRPLLTDDPRAALERLRAQREQWYLEVSRVRIDASGTLDDVTTRVREVAQKDEQ